MERKSKIKIMEKIRAIYIGDVRFDECPVFQLNELTNEFIMLRDNEFRYDKEVVFEDPDFLVFKVKNDRATMMNDVY